MDDGQDGSLVLVERAELLSKHGTPAVNANLMHEVIDLLDSDNGARQRDAAIEEKVGEEAGEEANDLETSAVSDVTEMPPAAVAVAEAADDEEEEEEGDEMEVDVKLLDLETSAVSEATVLPAADEEEAAESQKPAPVSASTDVSSPVRKAASRTSSAGSQLREVPALLIDQQPQLLAATAGAMSPTMPAAGATAPHARTSSRAISELREAPALVDPAVLHLATQESKLSSQLYDSAVLFSPEQ